MSVGPSFLSTVSVGVIGAAAAGREAGTCSVLATAAGAGVTSTGFTTAGAWMRAGAPLTYDGGSSRAVYSRSMEPFAQVVLIMKWRKGSRKGCSVFSRIKFFPFSFTRVKVIDLSCSLRSMPAILKTPAEPNETSRLCNSVAVAAVNSIVALSGSSSAECIVSSPIPSA